MRFACIWIDVGSCVVCFKCHCAEQCLSTSLIPHFTNQHMRWGCLVSEHHRFACPQPEHLSIPIELSECASASTAPPPSFIVWGLLRLLLRRSMYSITWEFASGKFCAHVLCYFLFYFCKFCVSCMLVCLAYCFFKCLCELWVVEFLSASVL